MADSKLSQLTQVSEVSGNALLYVSDSSRDRSISVQNFYAGIPNSALNGQVSFDDNVQVMTTGGIVDIDVPITDIHIDTDAHNISIPIPDNGKSQLKIILISQSSGGSYTLQGNIINAGNVVLSNKGDSAMLVFYSGVDKWFRM